MEPEPEPAAAVSAPPEPAPAPPPVDPEVERRNKVLADYRKVLLQHKETEAKVKQMREETACNIKVESVPTPQNERLVSLSGPKEAIVKAHLLTVLKMASIPDDGSSSNPSKFQRTGLARGMPGGAFAAVQAPWMGQAGGVPQFAPASAFGGQNPYPSAYPASQQGFSNATAQSQGFSPQPGFAQQGYAQQYGYGSDSQGFVPQQSWGAGAAAAPIAGPGGVTEQLVPSALVGRLIGKGGLGIRELRDTSRATIKISTDPEPGTDQRKVTVSGTPEQTQLALSMIQQRLAQGP